MFMCLWLKLMVGIEVSRCILMLGCSCWNLFRCGIS